MFSSRAFQYIIASKKWDNIHSLRYSPFNQQKSLKETILYHFHKTQYRLHNQLHQDHFMYLKPYLVCDLSESMLNIYGCINGTLFCNVLKELRSASLSRPISFELPMNEDPECWPQEREVPLIPSSERQKCKALLVISHRQTQMI